MNRELRLLPILLLLAQPALAEPDKPTFMEDVLPILRQSCLGCHNDEKQRGGLNLSTYAAVMEGGASGAVVKPGQPEQSRLFTLSAHTEEPKMPPNADRIPQPMLDLLKRWIEQGAREHAGSKMLAAKPAGGASTAVAVTRGRPEGPPPMPGRLRREPLLVSRRPGAVLALAASPWAPVVALGGLKQIVLYHLDRGELLGILPFPAGQVNVLRFSRNGQRLLAAGGRGGQSGAATLFDLASGKPIWTIEDANDAILAADLAPDETLAALGGPGKTIRIHATADGSQVHQIKKHTDWITALEFSPDGVLLASGDRNGGLFLWEADTAREFHMLRGPAKAITALSWRDDANALAVSSEDGNIRLYEPENGTQTKIWLAHGGGASCVRFDHDNRLVSTGRDRTAKLWTNQGEAIKAFEPFTDIGLRAAVSHDGRLVLGSDWSGEVRVWKADDAALVARLDTNPPPGVERFRRALARLADARSKLAEAETALAAARQAEAAAEAELAAFRKALEEQSAAAVKAAEALSAAKAEADKAAAAVTAAQHVEQGRAVPLKALEIALKQVQEAAVQQPDNAELRTQAGKLAEYVRVAKSDWEAASKSLAEAVNSRKSAQERFEAVQSTATTAQEAMKAAQDKLAAEESARQPTRAAVETAQQRINQARQALQNANELLLREVQLIAPVLNYAFKP